MIIGTMRCEISNISAKNVLDNCVVEWLSGRVVEIKHEKLISRLITRLRYQPLAKHYQSLLGYSLHVRSSSVINAFSSSIIIVTPEFCATGAV